jgi:MFS family permease
VQVLTALFGDEAEILRDKRFQILLLMNLFPPLGSAVLSPILDSLIDPLGTSPADVGLLISAFTAPGILVIPLAGLIADRYGRKPVLVASLLLFGTAGSTVAFTTDFRVALVLRMFQGVAYGGLTPIIITSIGDIYETTAEAAAQGFRFTGSGVATILFPLVSGGLVVVAWQYPFLLFGLALPVAVVVYVWFDEPADLDSDSGAAPSTVAADLRALAGLVRQRRVLAMVLARGFPVFVWIGFYTYNSIVIIRLKGGTPTIAGATVAAGSIAYAATASQAGRVTAVFESRLYPLIAGNICLGAGFIVFLYAPLVVPALLGIMLTGVGFGLNLAIYRSILTNLATEQLRGSLVSLAEGLGRIAATATPILMGATVTFVTPRLGFDAAVEVAVVGAAVVASLGGVLCMLVVSLSPPVRHPDLDLG